MNKKTLVLILGDQLSPDISSLKGQDKDSTIILMAEVAEEATYVKHHKKKIAFIFSAMRHFAQELRDDGWTVDYVNYTPARSEGSLFAQVAKFDAAKVIVTKPGEWRLLQDMQTWEKQLGVPVELREDVRFVCSQEEFADWAEGRKELRMEYFYREMRRKTGLLMHGDDPEGGQWNFDKDNRKAAKPDLFMPQPDRFDPDEITKDVLTLVSEHFGDHIGTLEPFWFATTRQQAEEALSSFITKALPQFGDYQDAMLEGEPFLYHSLLSFYINVGLLDPLTVCRAAEAAYYAGDAPLNSVEGFIRQIIGWREYIRGIYWLKMPEYVTLNFFKAKRPLPDFYWTADTKMACLKAAIGQTIEEAYAHHIQRLMITGNFAMLIGADPAEVHEWYLAVYADAYEWVELPNTLGMSQFADGGLLGSKPYAASGNYIKKMSNYCDGCAYKVAKKTEEDACPFNALYWDFMLRNREKLKGNPRISRAYSTWDRMDGARQKDYERRAVDVFDLLDAGKL